MKLAGDLKEFSLVDFLQIQSAAGYSGTIKILAPQAVGMVAIEDGRVLHATFGDLSGERALYALFAVHQGYFEAGELQAPERRTVEAPLSQLLFDFSALEKAGLVPQPRLVPRDLEALAAASPQSAKPSRVAPDSTQTPAASTPAATAAHSSPATKKSGPSVALLIGSASLGLSALAVVGWLVWGRDTVSSQAGAAPKSTASAAAALEASVLTGPGDVPPRFREGSLPQGPASDLAVIPTIVCRLLIDEQGNVREAKIYRSRVELAAFEEAALSAVQHYRFEPARKDGNPVAAWINYPLSFH